jgi:hypothetical protein
LAAPTPDKSFKQLLITDGRKVDREGYRRNNSVIVIALLLVLSLFDAFLSASITRSIAALKTIVAEFLTAHEMSSYPKIAEIMASPTIGLTTKARGASRIISLITLRAWTRHRAFEKL